MGLQRCRAGAAVRTLSFLLGAEGECQAASNQLGAWVLRRSAAAGDKIFSPCDRLSNAHWWLDERPGTLRGGPAEAHPRQPHMRLSHPQLGRRQLQKNPI